MRQARSFFILLFAASLLGGCSSMTKKKTTSPLSEHYDGKRFFNPWGANNTKSLWDVLAWKLTSKAATWPEQEHKKIDAEALIAAGKSDQVHVTYIGHATTYIQNNKLSILTDPHFSHRASPLSFAGPSRIRKPAFEILQLPAVDIVLISHNHYDHLDLPTLKELEKRFHPHFIVPLGNAELLKSEGLQKITELDWWEKFENIQLVPAQHWSARAVSDRNEALWGGYVITMSDQKIYFAGDTGYGPHFKMIGEKSGPIKLAILPIGAYEPRWFMKDQHLNPDDAIQAHLDLKSEGGFAIHFETFQLTDEGFDEPRNQLNELLKKYNVPPAAFLTPQFGETFTIKESTCNP
jgi:L-ascorbate metabolism protein UlaG (beta-lactamase superfamily)